MKKGLLVMSLAFLLMACQANEAGDKNENEAVNNEEAAENTEVLEENESNENNLEEVQVDYDLYDKVLQEYKHYYHLPIENVDLDQFDFVREGLIDYHKMLHEGHGMTSTADGVFYTYEDINGDGIDNLIIASTFQANDQTYYQLLDLYTIADHQASSLIDHELSFYLHDDRGDLHILENGDLTYTSLSPGTGEELAVTYQFDQAASVYKEADTYSDEDGNMDQIHDMIDKKQDLANFSWEALEEESESTVDRQFLEGDYTALEGIWENAHGEKVTIQDGQLSIDDEETYDINLNEDHVSENMQIFSVMTSDGIGGFNLIFYPAGHELTISIDEETMTVPSKVEEDKFYMGQDVLTEEEEIFYKAAK